MSTKLDAIGLTAFRLESYLMENRKAFNLSFRAEQQLFEQTEKLRNQILDYAESLQVSEKAVAHANFCQYEDMEEGKFYWRVSPKHPCIVIKIVDRLPRRLCNALFTTDTFLQAGNRHVEYVAGDVFYGPIPVPFGVPTKEVDSGEDR